MTTNNNFNLSPYALPTYIPDFKLKNIVNNKKEDKKDEKYNYIYFNVDSRYRKKEEEFILSDYFYLEPNPLIINPESDEIIIKVNDNTLKDFKDIENITIENIQPIQISDNFDNIFNLSLEDKSLIFKNLPNYLRFNINDNIYLCTIEFLNIDIKKFEEERGLNVLNYQVIHKMCDNYYINLNNDYLTTLEKYNLEDIKIKILFYYVYNIPYNEISSNLIIDSLNNKKYRTIFKKDNYYYFKTSTVSNLKDSEYDEDISFVFGGNNMRIRQIKNIIDNYQNNKYYEYEFKETLKNIESVKIINSAFPCFLNNITDKNNKFYFKLYNDNIIKSLSLNTGFYTADKLKLNIEKEIRKFKDNEDIFYDSIVEINEDLNNFSIKLFKYKSFNFLNIISVYVLDNYNNLILCQNEEEMKNYSENSECHILLNIELFEDLENNQKIQFKTLYKFIQIYIFNDILFIPTHSLKSAYYLTLENKHFIICDILKDIESLKKIKDNTTELDKFNLNFTINIPLKFSLLFNYSDTFGSLLGFSDIGKSSAITDYEYIITNKTNYFNQVINLHNHINLTPYKYIYCVWDKEENIKSNVRIKDNEFTNIFAIFYIYKQKSKDNYIYDSFVQNINSLNKYDYLNKLRFYFYNPDGELVDFQNLEHSFVLEFKCKN